MSLSKALSFTLVLILSPMAFAEMSGILMVVKGEVTLVSKKTGEKLSAKVGKKVFEGDSLESGPTGRAKIVMADKNVINISPNSQLVIEKYVNDGSNKNVELNVLKGKVRASVEERYDGEKNKFNVKTPSAVAGVRGTDFITGYNPSTRISEVITFSGIVAVGQPGPKGAILNPVFVNKGQMTKASLGKAPEPPKELPIEELKSIEIDAGDFADLNSDISENPSEPSSESSEQPVADTNLESNREPAAIEDSSMIMESDLSPEQSSAIQLTTEPLPTATVSPTPITTTIDNQFINDAILTNQKSRTTIILER